MGTKAKNEISDRAKARTQRMVNYLEVFTFPDLWWQPYPVYHVSDRGNMYSIKSILYPNAKSAKKYSRKNQLVKRSLQAKLFDCLVSVGFFEPLIVAREFPFIIQAHNKISGMGKTSFFLTDFFFPQALGGKGLIVELDSEFHSELKDGVRDEYLKQAYGVQTFRINHFERSDVQKGKFKELCSLLRSEPASDKPRVFNFSQTIQSYINEKLGPIGGMKLEDLGQLLINDEDLEE